jgi:hypothetical protein
MALTASTASLDPTAPNGMEAAMAQEVSPAAAPPGVAPDVEDKMEKEKGVVGPTQYAMGVE